MTIWNRTGDNGLRNRLDKYSVIVVAIAAFDNRLKSLIPFISKIEARILETESPDKIIEIDLKVIS